MSNNLSGYASASISDELLGFFQEVERGATDAMQRDSAHAEAHWFLKPIALCSCESFCESGSNESADPEPLVDMQAAPLIGNLATITGTWPEAHRALALQHAIAVATCGDEVLLVWTGVDASPQVDHLIALYSQMTVERVARLRRFGDENVTSAEWMQLATAAEQLARLKIAMVDGHELAEAIFDESVAPALVVVDCGGRPPVPRPGGLLESLGILASERQLAVLAVGGGDGGCSDHRIKLRLELTPTSRWGHGLLAMMVNGEEARYYPLRMTQWGALVVDDPGKVGEGGTLS